MTKITKPVIRETAVTERGDILVAEMHPKYVVMRFKGKREQFPVGWDEILDLARKIQFRREYGGRK
ncbi:MAG: hypothetical protein WDO73_02850 [Ignavibacteriota bacterium]